MPLQGEDGQLQGTNELPESGPVKAGHLGHWMALLERVLETLVAQNASNIRDYLLAGGKGKQNTATLSVQVFALVNDVTRIQ